MEKEKEKTLEEKKEEATKALQNVEAQLEQLRDARQQLIGRIQTYKELVDEVANKN